MNKLKKYFLALIILEMLFGFSVSFAAEAIPDYSQGIKNEADMPVSGQIMKYLCAPSPTTSAGGNNDLYTCINKLYKFMLVFASVMAFFFTVIAGYVYMSAEGNSESVEKAKAIFTSSLTALVILFSAYILLRAINPDLVAFKTFQPYSVSYTPSPVSEGTGGGSKTVIGSNGIAGCINCADYTKTPYNLLGNSTQRAGQNTFLNQTLASKLATLKSKYSNLVINESYPPTVDHDSACHFNGSCADIGTTANRTAAELEKFCKAAKESGLIILNEYPNINTASCGNGTQTSKGNGGHLHVKY